VPNANMGGKGQTQIWVVNKQNKGRLVELKFRGFGTSVLKQG
jgi:hypothetical protein